MVIRRGKTPPTKKCYTHKQHEPQHAAHTITRTTTKNKTIGTLLSSQTTLAATNQNLSKGPGPAALKQTYTQQPPKVKTKGKSP